MAYHNKGGYVDKNVPMLGAFGEMGVSTYKPLAAWTFSYNINLDFVKITTSGTGSVVHDRSFAKLSTGTGANASAKIETYRALRYQPGIGGLSRFTTMFFEPVEGYAQIQGIGANDTDGLFFGYNGLKFGCMRRTDSVDEWYYEEDWLIDRPVKQDWKNLNVYQIQFQWLGGGELRFFIENNRTGGFELVHFVRFAGKHLDVSLRNPSLPLMAKVYNTDGC